MALAIFRVHSDLNISLLLFRWTWLLLLDLSSAESSGSFTAAVRVHKYPRRTQDRAYKQEKESSDKVKVNLNILTGQHGSTVLQQRLRGSI